MHFALSYLLVNIMIYITLMESFGAFSRPQGLSGFSFEESPFASLNPNPQVGGLHAPHSAPSNFTPTSGNPFG